MSSTLMAFWICPYLMEIYPGDIIVSISNNNECRNSKTLEKMTQKVFFFLQNTSFITRGWLLSSEMVLWIVCKVHACYHIHAGSLLNVYYLARVGPSIPRQDRPIREGTRVASIETGLAAAAAKLSQQVRQCNGLSYTAWTFVWCHL